MTSVDLYSGIGEGPTQPITVTLSEGTLAVAREVGGPRGVSSLVERALVRELRLMALREIVDDYEREHGVIPQADVAIQMARLDAVRAGAEEVAA